MTIKKFATFEEYQAWERGRIARREPPVDSFEIADKSRPKAIANQKKTPSARPVPADIGGAISRTSDKRRVSKEDSVISKKEYNAMMARLDKLERTARSSRSGLPTKKSVTCPDCGHVFVPAEAEEKEDPKDKPGAEPDEKAKTRAHIDERMGVRRDVRWDGKKTLTPAEARLEATRRAGRK